LASTTGAVATYVFRANDLFDPDFTSTGHQPMGFDQMMIFYNHFAVSSARIKVNFTNTSTSTFHAGIRMDANSTPLTNTDQIVEFGGVSFDALEGKATYGCSKTFEEYVDIARIQGIPKGNITTDPNLRGDSATSPLEITYFHLFAWDAVTSTTGTVNADVTIDYTSWFMEPRDATESISRTLSNLHVDADRKVDDFTCLHLSPPVSELTTDFVTVGCGCAFADHSFCKSSWNKNPTDVSGPCCCSNRNKVSGVG